VFEVGGKRGRGTDAIGPFSFTDKEGNGVLAGRFDASGVAVTEFEEFVNTKRDIVRERANVNLALSLNGN
jgi:hypothetical protein